jgi:hypothetical protein
MGWRRFKQQALVRKSQYAPRQHPVMLDAHPVKVRAGLQQLF